LDGSDINGDGSTVTNGASISTWKDKSGKGHNATGNGAIIMTNALNERSVVDLRGQTSMLFPLGSSTTSYTIFTVQYGKSSSSYQRLLNGYPDNILLYGFPIGTTNWMTAYFDGSIGNLVANTPVIDIANRYTLAGLIVRGDLKTTICAVDGTPQDTRSWSTVNPLETLQIGTFNDQYWQGYVAEILVYTGTVSNSDRQTMEGYLAWKWGLQTSLPTSHPYKLSPPSTTYGTGIIFMLPNFFIIDSHHYHHHYHH
jgi:hypothetical protein